MYDSKILIVENDYIVAEDLKQILEKMGYDIRGITATGQDAITKTGETNPDLILMDIMLNGNMDGIEAAQQIHNIYNIPFVYLSAYLDNATLKRAKITEPYGYISKPFDNMRMQSTIERAVYNHQKDQNFQESYIQNLCEFQS